MAAEWAEAFSHRVSMLAVASQGVADVKEHPTHFILADFAKRLESLASSLKELKGDLEVHNIGFINPQQREMEEEVAAVERLVVAHKAQCQLSLLLSCPFLLMKLQSCRGNLSKALELITPETCTTALKLQISQTQRELEEKTPKLAEKEQAVIESLGMVTVGLTPEKSTELAEQVAECLGVSLGSDAFVDDLEELKREKEKVKISDDDSFAVYIEQCIAVLEKGVESRTQQATTYNDSSISVLPSPPSWNVKGLAAPSSPLPSFICPITKQVMKDPVQIASGQTYERAAIEQWFNDGNSTCPLGEKLKNTKMKSNFALRQSISEWKERNFYIRLDNAEWQLRSFQPIEQARGARDIKTLCDEDPLNKYAIASRKIIPLLIQLADSGPSKSLELTSFNSLAALAQDHHENQEILVKEGVIDMLVRCLRRNYDDAQAAISLLKILSNNPEIAGKISRTPDLVLLLVTLLGHKNEVLVVSVKAVLVNLPTTDENVVIMAEANLMKPLVTRLVEGGQESKILMARTLARLVHMPDSSRSLASTHESIFTLTNMMNSATGEEVDAAIGAVKNLSSDATVCITIADCSGLEVLIRLLNSSSVSTKEGAAFIVANVLIARGNNWPPSEDRDIDLDTHIESLLIVIAYSASPPAVQSRLLQGLLGLAEGKVTGRVAREKMMERNVFSALIPLLQATQPAEVRRAAIKLFSRLACTYGEEACGAVKIHSGTLQVLIDILRGEDTTETEKVAVAKIIAHFPPEDNLVTSMLLGLSTVPLLVKYLDARDQAIKEAAVGALVRFTSPNSIELQKSVAGLGVIPKLVNLLDSGRSRTKISAAKALANFSKSSPQLVNPVIPRMWWQCVFSQPELCKLHAGQCSIETTFCLLEADAVTPLLAMVAENDRKVTEEAMLTLYTLLDNAGWARGCRVINQAHGIPIIINHLPHESTLVREVALNMCEKFFQLPEFQKQFGVSAQMHIITLAQTGAPKTKDIAGRILRQLDLLHTQSHYFGYNSSTR